MAFISVVMPAYNAEATVEQSIISVLSQTYQDFEFIIIDDLSGDSTGAIIRRYEACDQRIRYYRNERNIGAACSRNRGIREANGQWIAFIDSDDVWDTDKLAIQAALAEKKPEIPLFYTSSRFMDAMGNPYGFVVEAKEITTHADIMKRNLISCSSVLVNAAVMKTIQMPSDKMHEDYYTWLTILKRYPCAYGIRQPLISYRLQKKSKSGNRIKSALMLLRTYRAVGFAPITAAALTSRYFFYSVSKRRKIRNSASV